MVLLDIYNTELPITNPILKFLIILIIILFAPLLLNKIKIPYLLGLIIAGAIIGPYGINLLERDSSIVLSGTAGLLYIMFLAGLEIDIADFKKNSKKSLIFGIYTFTIPMLLGTISSYYILEFSLPTSILLASMFASHTLISYPIISKLGITKNKAVNITVGGTVITDTLALLVLAIIVGISTGEVNNEFWIRLSVSIILFSLIILFLFPIISRWFFKNIDDSVSQYIFVLVMLYLGAVLAELAGVEGIIGAFLTGLALNKLIPHTSPLMNRIEFVGNAIFIPFFLIGVGMLIDYRAFIKDIETIKVAGVMISIATISKYTAAWLTQKTFKFSPDERRVIFGLSNAQAAATLAAVLVGYNIILGEDEYGEPIRLLNENVLNGTILMILFTCTIATLVAQKGAKRIALLESTQPETKEENDSERILISLNNIESAEELVNLGLAIKSKKNKENIIALTVIDDNNTNGLEDRSAKKILEKASLTAAATDTQITELLRYDLNLVNGISAVVKEQKITELIIGVQEKKGIAISFFNNITEVILSKCNTTTYIYKPIQPLGTIKRQILVIPPNAEKEIGFPLWLIKVWNLAQNTGTKLVVYSTQEIIKIIQQIKDKYPVPCEFNEFREWEDFLILSKEIKKDDNILIILSRKDKISYNPIMNKIPNYLNKYFYQNSFILIYPTQTGINEDEQYKLKNPAFPEPIEKLDEFGKTLAKVFKRK